MAMYDNPTTTIATAPSFTDFPEDVQLHILSFLTPPEISAFSCTSKRLCSLCRSDSKLWFALCHRRWAPHTHICKWGSGNITFKLLYRTLSEYENLIGFWRRTGNANKPVNFNPDAKSPLVFFEWGKDCIVGSRVSPSKTGGYGVEKVPFLWIGVSPKGDVLNYVGEFGNGFRNVGESGNDGDNELIPVNVCHIGKYHVVIEENSGYGYSRSNDNVEDVIGLESGSPPDRLTSEIYQYFANRTSPGGERSSRRQRRRERERQGRRKWEAEHFVKIVNCSPTPARPLQGLWKGIREDMNLDFYLVVYDDIGGVACRSVGDASKPFSGYAPVFWTSNTTFIESPLSHEEDYIYNIRDHLQPPEYVELSGNESVSRILYINSSYDLVIPELVGPSMNTHQVEGRIWQYEDGTFGFGFLRDNHIVDLRHIAMDGCLLDTVEPYKD